MLQDQYVVIGAAENSNNNESDLAYSRLVSRGGTGYCVVGNAPQGSPKSYSRVGVSPNTQTISSPSSGYISHPPVRSDSKNSLSPVPPPGPSTASKGYVMAGSMPVAQNPSKHPSTTYCRLGTTSDYVTLPSTSKTPSEL